MKRYDQIVIGSNSYLGINLCRNLDPKNCLLVSRSPVTGECSAFDFIQRDLSRQSLSPLFCNTVFILARPVTGSEKELIDFYAGLQVSIQSLLNVNASLVVHFVSSSLVFASDRPGALTVDSPLDLRQPYEQHKQRMEEWLRNRAFEYFGASFNVHRIPLLIGGMLRESDRQLQLFYRMYSAYREGVRWHFSDAVPDYGTSYADVADFSKWMSEYSFKAGFHVHLPSSGSITYRQLQMEFSGRCLPLPIKTTKECPSSFLILKNNTPLIQRDFSELFNP